MERYICIHGHFYQPPRENPWLDAIELQDSAYPYHDWNERITAECYAANGASRILDRSDRIVQIINNYARISFNWGPTLLAWLEDKAPEVYRAILDADRESQRLFSGHGSALTQAYNHMILPLANRRDKYTQISWGIRDFVHRFGRTPAGMWLPETAVDLESLDIMAELGIRFSILSPHQANRVRPIGGRHWRDVSGGRIDPTVPYVQRLPSGRSITLFFYDGPISRAVAFEGLLTNGEHFAQRLLSGFSEARTSQAQLVHIATDGETYGHHHRYGDMALAYALRYIESNNLARLTNYGEFLEQHRPRYLVEVYERTSWSCAHGIERWRSHCGCHSGMYPGWNQAWRAPLREALDWLRDTLAPEYEVMARRFLRDPWAARDDYIAVILTRSPESFEQFLDTHAIAPLSAGDKVQVLKLLELQRHAMLMYTSCGWFFDELSGIETVQILQYAGRAIQLAQVLFGNDIESHFFEKLIQAKSNIPEHRDGVTIYEKSVKPAMVDWEKIGAHYAVSSVFEPYPERTKLFCYTAEREDHQSFQVGRAKLVVGKARLTSEITHESAVLSFGVLHFGDHNVNGGVRHLQEEDTYLVVAEELSAAFGRAEFPEVIRCLDRHFGESTYSIKSLFRDEQRKVLNLLLESTLSEVEGLYRQVYERHTPLMQFLSDLSLPMTDLHIPLPKAFHMAASFILNIDLRRAFEEEILNLDRLRVLLEAVHKWQIELDSTSLGYTLQKTLDRLIEQLASSPNDLSLLRTLEAAAGLVRSLPFELSLWKVQNLYYDMLQRIYPEVLDKADQEDAEAQSWVDHFVSLGEALLIKVE
jgi:alpha-amylase/alpha-mannosidase (GH57 family)